MGKFFDTVIKILTIIHHLIWIIIGGVIIAIPIIILSIGPTKLIQQVIPSNSFSPSQSTSQQEQSSSEISPQSIFCAITSVGATRAEQLLSGQSQPTSAELQKLQACFPNGLPR